MHILLVDDEIEFVSAIAERLVIRGISTEWATSAEEAMRLIDKECFDIAVLDVKMPLTNGIELMQQIKAKCPGTQFIFLSGHASEQTYQMVNEKCPDAVYMIKPVNIHSLVDELKRLMKHRKDSDDG